MIVKVQRPGEVHVLTLCHSDGCCPQIFFSPDAPLEWCLRIADDYGNEAFFSPDALRAATPVPMSDGPAELALRDTYDNEVYVTREQLSVLYAESSLRLLESAAG